MTRWVIKIIIYSYSISISQSRQALHVREGQEGDKQWDSAPALRKLIHSSFHAGDIYPEPSNNVPIWVLGPKLNSAPFLPSTYPRLTWTPRCSQANPVVFRGDLSVDSSLQASMTFNSAWYSASYVHMLKNLALQKEPMALGSTPAHWITGVGQMTFVLQHCYQQQCQKDVHLLT